MHAADEVVELADRAWSQTWVLLASLDGEGLTGASLTVSEHADVVAIDSALDEALGLIEHLNLC